MSEAGVYGVAQKTVAHLLRAGAGDQSRHEGMDDCM